MRKVPITLLVLLFAASGLMAQTLRQEVLKTTKDSQLIEVFEGGGTNKGLGGQFYWEEAEGQDTNLYQWDVSGVSIPCSETIWSVELELFSADLGPYSWHFDITAFPMREAWQEGVGTQMGMYGGRGFPWDPTSIGDATWTWKSVTEVGLGVSVPYWQSMIVGKNGVLWEAPGALGKTSDCYDRLMIDQFTEGVHGMYPSGTSYGFWPFTAEGIAVVEEWIAGSLDNHGLVLAHENTNPEEWSNMRVGTRETKATPETAPGDLAPTLWITIGPHRGDGNEDGYVDGLDYVIWSNNYNLEPSTWPEGDYNLDDKTDGLDYVVWSNNYEEGCPPPGAVVPEPATMALLAMGALALLKRRRRS